MEKKAMVERRHENKRRVVEQSIQGKQETLQARLRQGEPTHLWISVL